jgi:hypothetical protein
MDSEELKVQQTAVLQRQSNDILHLTEGSNHNVAVQLPIVIPQQQKQDPTSSAETKKKKTPKTNKSATEAGGDDDDGGGVMEHDTSAGNTNQGAVKRMPKKKSKSTTSKARTSKLTRSSNADKSDDDDGELIVEQTTLKVVATKKSKVLLPIDQLLCMTANAGSSNRSSLLIHLKDDKNSEDEIFSIASVQEDLKNKSSKSKSKSIPLHPPASVVPGAAASQFLSPSSKPQPLEPIRLLASWTLMM